MERSLPARRVAGRLVELELEDPRQEIARIGRVARNMEFGARVKVALAPCNRRSNPLILLAKLIPARVVATRRDRAVENAPTPLIDQQSERKERHLVHRLAKQQTGVLGRIGHLVAVEQPDLNQIFRGHRQRDEIADRLVEPVIGPVQIKIGLSLVRPLVIIVSELVVDGHEVVAVDLGAHLDPQIVLIVEVPGRGMADHFAPDRPGDLRARPERLGKRRKPERSIKSLARSDHLLGRVLLLHQQIGQVIADVACSLGSDDVVDIAPFLRPHIAEQVGPDRPRIGLNRVPVLLVELGPRVAVELIVERLHFAPQPVVHPGKFLRAHVVLRAPHRARIVIAQVLRTRVRDGDHPRVVGAHRPPDILVPAGPDLLELGRIAKRSHRLFGIVSGNGLAVQLRTPLAVSRLQPRRESVELGRGARGRRRREHQRTAQDIELSRRVGVETGYARPLGRFLGIGNALLGPDRPEISGKRIGIVGNEGRIHPCGALRDIRQIEQVLLDRRNESARAIRRSG